MIVVLPAPETGPLAVLWWAAVLAFLILAVVFTIRAWFRTSRRRDSDAKPGGDESPSEAVLWVVFLVVVALVAAVLFAVHIVPGT